MDGWNSSFPVDGNQGASAAVANPLHSLSLEALSRTAEWRQKTPVTLVLTLSRPPACALALLLLV